MSFHRQTVLRVATVSDLLSGCGGSSPADCNRSRRRRILRSHVIQADLRGARSRVGPAGASVRLGGQDCRSPKAPSGSRQIGPSSPSGFDRSRLNRRSHVSKSGSSAARPIDAARTDRAIRSSAALSVVTTRMVGKPRTRYLRCLLRQRPRLALHPPRQQQLRPRRRRSIGHMKPSRPASPTTSWRGSSQTRRPSLNVSLSTFCLRWGTVDRGLT